MINGSQCRRRALGNPLMSMKTCPSTREVADDSRTPYAGLSMVVSGCTNRLYTVLSV